MYGEGLQLEGVTSYFGLIAVVILILIGIAMVLVTNIPKKTDLEPVSIVVQAPPYRGARVKHTLLLPVTGARVLALDQATYKAADTTLLFALKKGDQLNAWLSKPEAEKWNAGVGRKDFYTAFLLQYDNGNWIVDHPAYRKTAGGMTGQGWWLIILGVLLIPYQFIRRARFPAWAMLVLYTAAIILYYLFV